jgi:hypothetical protein
VPLHEGHGSGESQAAHHHLRGQDQPRGRAPGLRQPHPGTGILQPHPGTIFVSLIQVFVSLIQVFVSLIQVFVSLIQVFVSLIQVFVSLNQVFLSSSLRGKSFDIFAVVRCLFYPKKSGSGSGMNNPNHIT